VVRIQETRPISKTKHWRILEILQRRQVAEVRPIELESDVELADEAEEGLDELEDEAEESESEAAGDEEDQ
jgi:hypothetical protein